MQREPEGEDALLPVALEAADDMPHMAFINLAVTVKDLASWFSCFIQLQDFLLVFAGDLGIGDYEGRDQGVCPAAEAAPDTLDDERKKQAENLQMP